MNIKKLAASISGKPMRPDRGGYTLTMRECCNTAKTLHALSRYDKPEKGVHIGWGSFRNLDIVAVRASCAALICDVNIHQLHVWQTVEKVMPLAIDAVSFVRLLAQHLPSCPPLRQFSESTQHWLSGALDDPTSWLYIKKPSRFKHVKNLFDTSKIGFACLDLRGGDARNQTGDFIKLSLALCKARQDEKYRVDTIYLSNIPYMLAQRHGFYGEAHDQFQLGEAWCPLTAMWKNLELIALPDTWLFMADILSINSTAKNLQWRTRLLPFREEWPNPEKT